MYMEIWLAFQTGLRPHNSRQNTTANLTSAKQGGRYTCTKQNTNIPEQNEHHITRHLHDSYT